MFSDHKIPASLCDPPIYPFNDPYLSHTHGFGGGLEPIPGYHRVNAEYTPDKV